MNTISIAGLDKAEVLAALYNAAVPLGLGILHFKPEPMTREQAQALFDEQSDSRYGVSFDYVHVHGRPLKLVFDSDELRTGLYNRDQGDGAAERVIEQLRRERA